MKKTLYTVLIIVLSIMFVTPSFARDSASNGKTVYVSVKGKDSNSGRRSAPYRTIQHALDRAVAGTTVYVMDGTYKESIKFKKSGSKDKTITLKALNQGKAKLTLKRGKSGAIIDLCGKDYIRIEGFDIGNVSSKEVYGILLEEGTSNVVIKNNKIHDVKTTKPEDPGAGCNGILCLGEGNSKAKAISHITIADNEVYNNVTGWSESISVAGNCEYVIVKNNKVHDNTNIGIDFYGNAGYCPVASLDQPRFCQAYGNTVYRCKCSYAENAGIYVDGARDCKIYNNKVFDNIYGIEIGSEEGYGKDKTSPVTRIVVYGNNIYNNPSGGIRIGGYATDISGTVMDSEIYENTLTNNGAGKGGYFGEINIEKVKNLKVHHNVVNKTQSAQEHYPFLNIGSDVGPSFITGLKLYNNRYNTTLKASKATFYLFDKKYLGIDGSKGMKTALKKSLGVDMKDKVVEKK